MKTAQSSRVGVLLPCRNEAAVIERRLRNLARLEVAGLEPRLVVVDDHSTDDTAEVARRAFELLAGWRTEVISNQVRPGKNGAIEAGLAHLGGEVDLVVLTDADVAVDRGALAVTWAAFATDSRLGMACASQRFVRALPEDGSCPGEGGAALERADEAWDRWTAAVRRLESRTGRLFSVHGQWLAWRADLGLAPTGGVAADDVDLMLQVRASARPRVELLADARFFEEKPPAGEAYQLQGLRRARAWFQVFDGRRAPAGLTGLDRLQWWSYARLPGHLPLLAVAGLLITTCSAAWGFGVLGAVAVLVLAALVLCTPLGREWLRTLGLIRRARRLEREAAMPESWEMSRE